MVLSLTCALLASCGGGKASPPALPPNTDGWWRDRTVYEVFVRSFADSDGDGVGDLAGLAAHLDDLNDGDPATTTDLGVDALWLMPIFPSPSYHGYDVTDYRGVNPQYGTLADLDAVVQGAHARGMKVVLDMVLNHSSSQHPWFLDSSSGPSSARRDWYVWSATNPGWLSPVTGSAAWHYESTGGWYYAVFWGGMPDLNLGAPAVEQELVDSMKFWLARGVDGFRLDAVRYYFASGAQAQVDQPATHEFLKRIRAALQAEYPQTLLVAEAWASTATVATYYGEGDEVQLAFDFDLAQAIQDGLLGPAPAGGAGTGDAAPVRQALGLVAQALAGKDRGFDAPFLSNHDQVRVMRALGGDAAAARVAAATVLALPGTPFLYYGEEIGMRGGDPSGGDPAKRTPLPWTADAPGHGFTTSASLWCGTSTDQWCGAAETAGVDVATERADPGSLWNLYRRLLALRHAHAALTAGDVAVLPAPAEAPAVLALVRSVAGGRVLFVANYGSGPTGPFTVAASGAPSELLSEGLLGPAAAGAGAVTFPGLAGRGFAFLSLE